MRTVDKYKPLIDEDKIFNTTKKIKPKEFVSLFRENYKEIDRIQFGSPKLNLSVDMGECKIIDYSKPYLGFTTKESDSDFQFNTNKIKNVTIKNNQYRNAPAGWLVTLELEDGAIIRMWVEKK
jgi:hypothetical protein